MTEYRKQADGTLIEGVTAFKNLFPNTSFPKVIDEALVNSLGYDWVYDSTQPSVTYPYESVVRDGVEQVSGKWQAKFKVETADADGKTAIDNRSAISRRSERDELLKDSDWTVMPDSPLSNSKKAEWTTYRQKLRDITNGIDTEEKAKAVTWPTAPN